MRIFSTIVLNLLIILALSSGITKVALLQQDVEFFGKYGFSDPLLVAYGMLQIVGAALMMFHKTRVAGAAIVALSFLVSLLFLLMEGNIPVSIATVVATLLLGFTMKQSWRRATSRTNQS